MKSTLKNMIVVLAVITLVGASAVGGVYMLTKEPIKTAKIAKINNAIKEVMPGFDNNPYEDRSSIYFEGDSIRIYPAKNAGEIKGYAIETFTKNGFGGKVVLMIGILSDGTINSTAVVEQKETPGLGDKMDKKKSNFSVQFENKNPENFKLAVKKDGGDVDAITAATISSRAFVDAVDRAYRVFKTL